MVAADLMAQAEHDPMASCYLVTCDASLPDRVLDAVERLVSQSPREKITRASLDDRGVVVVAATLADAVEAVNVVAPEHLELHCEDAMSLLGSVRNAGAIFVGAWSSEPLGDYVAGPDSARSPRGAPRASPTPWASTTSRSTRALSPTRRRAFLRMPPPSRPWLRPRGFGRTPFLPGYA